MIGFAYEDAPAVETPSRHDDVSRTTVYYWLGRFEESLTEKVGEDEERPGRPPTLTPEDRDES